MEILLILISVVSKMIILLLMVAFLSLFERKLLGSSHIRKGPSIVGMKGLFQPFSDAMKLVSKIDSSPEKSGSVGFFLPAILFFFISLSLWISFPFKFNAFNFQMSGLFLIFWMSVGVYGLIFSGWYSFSKFSTLGLCRAIIQSISYEIVLSFGFFSIFLISGSVNLVFIFSIFGGGVSFFLWSLMIVLFISLLTESGRTPFDLPEGESELVGGYSVEYGGVSYTVLFLGENLSILFGSFLMVIFFLGEGMNLVKFSFFLSLFILIRSTLPRVRFDKLMEMCWLEMIPILMGLIFIFSSIS